MVVARSSISLECRSLARITASCLETLLSELQVSHTTLVFCDNMCIVALAHNSIPHTSTKHMELGLFFAWKRVVQLLHVVINVPTFSPKLFLQLDSVLCVSSSE